MVHSINGQLSAGLMMFVHQIVHNKDAVQALQNVCHESANYDALSK